MDINQILIDIKNYETINQIIQIHQYFLKKVFLNNNKLSYSKESIRFTIGINRCYSLSILRTNCILIILDYKYNYKYNIDKILNINSLLPFRSVSLYSIQNFDNAPSAREIQPRYTAQDINLNTFKNNIIEILNNLLDDLHIVGNYTEISTLYSFITILVDNEILKEKINTIFTLTVYSINSNTDSYTDTSLLMQQKLLNEACFIFNKYSSLTIIKLYVYRLLNIIKYLFENYYY